MRKELLAVDPGDIHTGYARFGVYQGEWQCFSSDVWEWEEAHHRIAEWCHDTRVKRVALVCESWRLLPDRAAAIIGSELLAVQLIGAARYLARMTGTPWATQPPSILPPAKAIRRVEGIEPATKRTGALRIHAVEAECHGWLWLWEHSDVPVSGMPPRNPATSAKKNSGKSV